MTSPRLLLVDNVDSFTFMLADYLRSAGAEVEVVRNRDLDVSAVLATPVDGFVISPGPGTPDDAGISVPLAAACIEQGRPLLGVCLGHQAIARACGQPVVRTAPVHGKVATIRHDGSGIFGNLPSTMKVTRYHSLAVPNPLPPLLANAWAEDGTVMAMRHSSVPVHGLQFHPESIASEYGRAMLSAFIELAMTKA